MSDRLYLSCWVRGFDASNMLGHFSKLLETFPVSKLSQRGPVLRVYAMEFSEPPAGESVFETAADVSELIGAARQLVASDCAVEVESAWDLWRLEGEWQVLPSPVTLLCLGPGFDNEIGDHLRIDFGLDGGFLPADEPESLRMHESNLRSLITLVGEIEQALPLERRQLWSESGANFAEVLSQALARFGAH